MKNRILTALAAGLATATLAVSAQAQQQLRVVSFIPQAIPLATGFQAFIDGINDEFAGEVQLNWIGGPEVINPFDLADAVRNGAIDVALISPSYYSGTVPASTTNNLSMKTYEEIRGTGYYERLDELHADRGLKFWGEIPASEIGFNIWLGDEITSLDDIRGKRIRVFPTAQPFLEAMGANTTIMPIGEIFTAMERGVIDGFVQGNQGWAPQYGDVVSHYVSPQFYRAGFNVLVNQDAWNRMSEDLRERLQTYLRDDLAYQLEAESWDQYLALGEQEIEEAGYVELRLEGDDAEDYLNQSLETAWDLMREDLGEDLANELMDMLVD
ncbi:hypothetical protein E4656_08815 [Natronospirillum operosum]|uniref:C4-dicarboxylate ABC transporter substrate-binding protein n=1 Tax=Natronospirillum operosum TaxID=2759953 RepID=A0A4Z0WGA4_9GAMM|nr:TRAP transporter substrate-binding protein DctP [Natronospirillum operosum]TGG94256.1 hypothetical protein E4656_08815 [Natronospirillum operosum]